MKWPRSLRLVRYVLLLIVLLEGVARAVFSSPDVLKSLRGLDVAQRIGWARPHGADQKLAFRFDVYDSLRGWALKPGIESLRVFRGKVLNSSSHAVRGIAENTYDRTPGKRRILVFGDSFTFGDEVSDGETYAAQLAQLLPNVEVLNLGVHGYGHEQMLLYVEQEGLKYHPDLVIIGFVWFDMLRNASAFQSFAKPMFTIEADSFVLTRVPVPTPEAVQYADRWRLRLWDMASAFAGVARARAGYTRSHAEDLTRRIFDRFVRAVRANGAEPLIVYLPTLAEMIHTDSALSSNERFLDSYCSVHGVPCLFLRPRFADARSHGVAFDTTAHWDPVGHRLAAEGIAEYLTVTLKWGR